MKVSATKKAEHRAAILAVAGRLLREKGPSGVGIAEVMAGAGMTHGGFYGHFPSREELNAVAIAHALQQATGYLAKAVSDGGLAGFARQYLRKAHLEEVARGCPIAAIATEVPRQSGPIRDAFAKGLRDYLAAGIPEGADRAAALARHCGLIGALILARAVADKDRALAEELLLVELGANRERLCAEYLAALAAKGLSGDPRAKKGSRAAGASPRLLRKKIARPR